MMPAAGSGASTPNASNVNTPTAAALPTMYPNMPTNGTPDLSDPVAAAAYFANYAQNYQAAFAAAAANGQIAPAATAAMHANATNTGGPTNGTNTNHVINNGSSTNSLSNAIGMAGYGNPQAGFGYNGTNGFPPMAATTYSAPFQPNFGFPGAYNSYTPGVNHAGPTGRGHTSTTECRDFRQGRCTRGATCRFSHQINGSGNAQQAKSNEICGDFIKGRCMRGDQCKYSHDKATG